MNASTRFTTVINLQVAYSSVEKRYLVTSPNLSGLILAGPHLPTLLEDVPAAIKLLYKHNIPSVDL